MGVERLTAYREDVAMKIRNEKDFRIVDDCGFVGRYGLPNAPG